MVFMTQPIILTDSGYFVWCRSI